MLVCALFCAGVSAKNKMDTLQVDNDVVVFATSEAKTHTLPACVAAESTELWSLSLATPSGRTNYNTLLVAMSNGITVKVESAGDCAVTAGIERAGRIWLEQ